MDFSLLTPEKKLVESVSVEEIFAPGVEGTLNILKDHANFVTALETGVIRWKSANTWHAGVVSRGILEIFNGHISILAEVAELGDQINSERAKAALEKARKKVEDGGLEDGDYQKQTLKLKRAISRIEALGQIH